MKTLKTQSEITSSWGGNYDEPVVSICCITYNHEAYIEETLEGFLIQETDFPFEILIHDDASTDGTADIIRKYEAKYPTLIKPIYQVENQYSKGRKINPEFNFPRAKGKYIALCEGDDFWTDHKKLQIQKDFLDSHPEYVICYTDALAFNSKGLIDKNYAGARRDLPATGLQQASSVSTLTAFFRNVLTENQNPAEFCNVRYGDLTLWSRLGDYGKGKYLPSVKPSMYRVHTGGIHSMQTRKKQLQMRLETMMGLYSYRLKRSENDLADFFLEEIVVQALKLQKFKLIKNLLQRAFNALCRKASSLLSKR
ncbi:glycosyl transferase [Methylophaga lonarensis MPL]|uniref:Glycosyl transferase n=1 Tax=Methylophaga lonarensis MPL TaxID=1286106 RepID=M7NX83_9GAMM|nr:glycosyltransferase [Methylophaga lonarensis]EMR11902.1 glycosyl transferase [Methylophaga lonarensis MPL]